MFHRALITGIPGFAGGFLADHLLALGDAVLGCSLDGNWEPASEPGLFGRVELATWDLARDDGLPEPARRRIWDFRPDRVYHLAALSVPADSGEREPTPAAVAINVGGTRRVLELVAAFDWRCRVLAVSSSKVYRWRPDDSGSLSEDAPLEPATAYGRTKLAAEEETRRAVRQRGVDAVIARAFQHTGPRQNARMMLPEWARQFAAGGDHPVEVRTREATIDLSDVRDVVRAYRLLLEVGRTGEAYNIGSGIARLSGDVLEMLQRAAGTRRAIVEHAPGRKSDPLADISRLTAATRWRPETAIETTVADTLAWWRAMWEKGKV